MGTHRSLLADANANFGVAGEIPQTHRKISTSDCCYQ
jgi:hypothetical protein